MFGASLRTGTTTLTLGRSFPGVIRLPRPSGPDGIGADVQPAAAIDVEPLDPGQEGRREAGSRDGGLEVGLAAALHEGKPATADAEEVGRFSPTLRHCEIGAEEEDKARFAVAERRDPRRVTGAIAARRGDTWSPRQSGWARPKTPKLSSIAAAIPRSAEPSTAPPAKARQASIEARQAARSTGRPAKGKLLSSIQKPASNATVSPTGTRGCARAASVAPGRQGPTAPR